MTGQDALNLLGSTEGAMDHARNTLAIVGQVFAPRVQGLADAESKIKEQAARIQ